MAQDGHDPLTRFPHPRFRRDALDRQLKSTVVCDAFKRYPEEHEKEIRDMFNLYPPDIFGIHQLHNDLRILRKEGRIRTGMVR